MMLRELAFAAACLFVAESAFAHDHWINHLRLTDPQTGEWCCNAMDCEAVPAGGISEVRGGYYVRESAETIPQSRVIWRSRDGAWWRCRNLATGKTRCLIGPPPSF